MKVIGVLYFVGKYYNIKKAQLLFAEELKAIQLRHGLFFRKEDMALVKLKKHKDGYRLDFITGIDLPSIVKMEIEFAYKMAIG